MVPLLLQTVWRIIRNLEAELPFDLAVLTLDTCLKELTVKYPRDACISMFIAVVFTTAQREKLEYGEDMVYTYNKVLSCAPMWMNLDILLREIIQSEKEILHDSTFSR